MAFAGGTGTIQDPYLVATASQLNEVRNNLSAHYRQIADINLSSFTNWVPIGTLATPFKGSYNGGNYKITNLVSSRLAATYTGLFGFTSGSLIRNVNCYTGTLVEGSNNVGIIVGGAANNSEFRHCYAEGNVKGLNDDVGGFVGGTNSASKFIDCHVKAKVIETQSTSYYNVGGFIGGANNASFEQCSAICEVVTGANDDVGGFVGYSFNASTYLNCFAICNLTGTQYGFGGFVGDIAGGSVTNCYAAGTINATGTLAGFAAHASGAVFTNCFYDFTTLAQADSYAVAKTTEEMKTEGTYINWDFTSTWLINPEINNGYPSFLLFNISIETNLGIEQIEKIFVISFNEVMQTKELKEIEKVAVITNEGLIYS